ncbi:MAG: hypothetical protein HMLIMOIP_001186 [Candidatus Nitrosomirales archaeon]|jgi:hypothetical protein
MKNNYPLALFVDNMDSWHIALFYEEPEHARVIEFQFIKNGLKKRQSCCYITYENREFIENEMADNGVDVAHYTKNSMLQIIESTDLLNDPRGTLATHDGETWKMCAKSSTPFRVVGGISIRDTLNMINNPERGSRTTNAQLEMEHDFHNKLFDGLHGYWLCPYSVNDIKAALSGSNYDRNLIMVKLMRSHHGVVLATKSGKGLSLFMPGTP